MLYIGIDLGTSSVKCLLCDEKGNILKSETRDYPIYFPRDGYSEQNPEDWYNGVIECIKALKTGYEKNIAGLSVAGQMHGLVMLDEKDEVIRNAILWNDSRSYKECEYLNNVIGKEKMTEMTGNIAFPGFTAPKILWVRENEKENFEKCRKIMLPKDYIIYKLTGSFATEPSDAAGMLLFDVKNKCYSKQMLKICHISEDMLPKVYDSFEKCGTLKAELSKELGLERVICAPGAGDNAAAAVGMGVVGEGGCSLSLGTSGTVFIAREHFSVDKNNALHSFNHADGNFHLMGCILSAASCNKWWIEDVLKSNDYGEFENENITGENRVIFLPYLMGERSPHNDPYARGAFVGMGMDTKRRDMAMAVQEGVCYALRECVEIAKEEGCEINEVRVCGGGSKSDMWLKMLANILRVKVRKPLCSEGPGFGAAILAMVANGEYKTVKEATDSIVKMGEEIDFDEALAQKYDKCYRRFKKLYRQLKEWYKDEE